MCIRMHVLCVLNPHVLQLVLLAAQMRKFKFGQNGLLLTPVNAGNLPANSGSNAIVPASVPTNWAR